MKIEKSEEIIVVGIGVCADGMEVLLQTLQKIKASQISFVIVQHLSQGKPALTKDKISSITQLPVEEVVNGSIISPGTVYLAPAHCLLSIVGNQFEIREANDMSQKLSTIDWFLKNLGEEYKHLSIGILISSEALDGVIGLRAISENGGLTISQAEMVAVEAGFVDHIVNPDEIAGILAKHEKFLGRLNRPENMNLLNEEIGSALISICDILYTHSKHDFKHYKTSTLVRRIRRRMQILQIMSVADYVEILSANNQERISLFNDLLINVTSFFRDPDAFEALKNDVITDALLNKKEKEKYRVWVAGSSTGEEVYTLAILINEVLQEKNLKVEVQIIATDIDDDALNIARKGEYSFAIAERISPQRLEKYFQPKNGRLSVTRQLREMCLFSSHNLILDPPFSQLDLISCRNVLIYLGLHLQKKLIPVFHYALRPGGHLFLGTSEALSTHKDLFNIVSTKYRIAERRETAINHPAQSFFNTMNTSYASHFKEAPKTQEEDLHLIGQRIILDEFAPRFAIVGDEFQVLSVSSGIAEFFEPNEGSFQNNIVKLVKQNLRSPLRASLNDARKQKRQINHHSSIIKTSLGMQRVGITVQPMPQLGGHTSLFMVVFKDFGLIVEESPTNQGYVGVDLVVVDELERELASVREELDKSVQDLEASNEELKSSNEELLSMNEELQSANEQLESSKEEVQHINDTLQQTNSDLENLLNSTKIATIFLDDNLNIKSFTPTISHIYDLVEHDIGRPITNFVSKAHYMPAYSYPNDLKPDDLIETEVMMPDGQIYLRRKSAYLGADRKQKGLVVTFVNITELRRQEGLFKTLANSVPQLIWSTDNDGNYIYFSDQWKTFSGLDPESIKNKGFREIVHPEDMTRAMMAWDDARKTGTDFNYEYRLLDKHGTYHWFLFMAKPMKDGTGKVYRWFGSATDIQLQKELQHSLLATQDNMVRNKRRFDLVAESVEMGIWFCDLPFDRLNWSETVKKHFWLRPDAEVTINTFYDQIHPDDREPTRKKIDYSISNKSPYDTTFRTCGPNEEIRYVRAIGWTDYDANNNPKRFDGITFDITDTMLSMEKLKTSETRYELASRATREIIWDWNLITNKVEWNSSLTSVFGYSEKDRKSDSQWWYEHIHPEDRERVVHGIHEVIDAKGVYWTDIYRFQKNDGSYSDIRDQGYVLHENGQPIRMIGAMQDETTRNKQILEIHKAISARDEFLSIASHELKTPVTSMHLQMQMLKRKMDKGEALDHNYVNRINQLALRQCKHLTSLIDDMLDVSRISAGKMQFNFDEIELDQVVSGAMENFSVNLEEQNILVESKIESGIKIKGDVFRLEQVVYNLLTNAVKYGLGKPISIHVYREKNFGVIEVKDHGMGISKENLTRIFDRFERVISATNINGLGLGLFISKEIIISHEGYLSVDSKINEGSTFTVRFPLIGGAN